MQYSHCLEEPPRRKHLPMHQSLYTALLCHLCYIISAITHMHEPQRVTLTSPQLTCSLAELRPPLHLCTSAMRHVPCRPHADGEPGAAASSPPAADSAAHASSESAPADLAHASSAPTQRRSAGHGARMMRVPSAPLRAASQQLLQQQQRAGMAHRRTLSTNLDDHGRPGKPEVNSLLGRCCHHFTVHAVMSCEDSP